MNKTLRFCLLCCCFLASFNQVAFSQQRNTEPLYYLGITGHFEANQTYANSGLIVDKVAKDSPFRTMVSLERGEVRSLRQGERISSLGDGTFSSPGEYYKQIDQSKHRHGRMVVTIHSSDRDTDGKMFLIQAQPLRKPEYRLGITAAPGQNGGAVVTNVSPGVPATKLWSPTQNERNIALEPNDEIMSINGSATPNSTAVIQALASSENGVATLRVRNVRTGAIEIFFAEPDRVSSGPMVHYVIVGQSATREESFDYGIMLDMRHLDMLTRHIRHEFIGSSVILEGEQCTAANIKKAVSAIDAKPDDTIFVYYSGHGAHDSNGHRFTLDGHDLYRKEVAAILKQKRVRLSVFVSDSCNGDSTPIPENTAQPAGWGELRTTGFTKFESLLLNYRGVIDLNAADKNHLGWSDTQVGGYFTYQFAKYLTNPQSNPKDWEEALNAIANNGNAYYKQSRTEEIESGRSTDVTAAMKKQLEMTPEVFEFSVQSAPAEISVGPRTFEGIEPVNVNR